VAFAAFGSSRYLVVAADSATAAIFAGGISSMATPAGAQYVALAGIVALLTAVILLLARLLRLGFIADFLSRTVLVGFLAGVGLQVGIAVLSEMLGVPVGFAPGGSAALGSAPRIAACPSAESGIGGFGVSVCGGVASFRS
jgi:sulfate permease, SulP family